jgi:hypothetical protein
VADKPSEQAGNTKIMIDTIRNPDLFRIEN